jgi:hypothetical protein
MGCGLNLFIMTNKTVLLEVLDLIWLEPLLFEFYVVNFSGLQKPHDMVTKGKGFLLVVLVCPFY